MEWVLFIFGVVIAIVLWVKFRGPRPEFMPLSTEKNDPLLVAAMERARKSVDQFHTLYTKYPEDAFVKIQFTSSSGEVEHLAAHVEGIDGDMLDILLVTPPVTHKGTVERRRLIHISEIEDWQITEPDGAIHGGFTQRVMFDIAHRDGIALPKKLREMEAQYVPIDPDPDRSAS